MKVLIDGQLRDRWMKEWMDVNFKRTVGGQNDGRVDQNIRLTVGGTDGRPNENLS